MYKETIRQLINEIPKDSIIANRIIINDNCEFIDHTIIFTSNKMFRPELIQYKIDKYNIPRITNSKMLIEKDNFNNRYIYRNYKFFNINNLDMS